jgi:UDP-N-acetylmuramoyl-L-alanyl-D-glutamate--2,6-diaminopimelate ligase
VGTHTDGHLFIHEALSHGAVAIVHSQPLPEYQDDILYIQSKHPRRLYSAFSSALHGYPQLKLPIIGVTGTDGKTSTCEILHQLLVGHGLRCGLLDTISMDDGTGKRPSPYRQSTPEATEIHAFLVRCVEHEVRCVVLEATSHGLSREYARLADIPFTIAIFTTLTSEHLEFHQTLDNYVQSKLNLARQLVPEGLLIMPASFGYLTKAKQAAPPEVKTLTYALDEGGTIADLQVNTLRVTLERRYFTTVKAGRLVRSSIPLAPAFFLRNALGSILAASRLLEKDTAGLLRDLTWIDPIHGRFEVYPLEDRAVAIIDFAHTADAFSCLFAEVRLLRPEGRMIAVFGAAGERDKSKRAPMGCIAANWCQTIILTDEDPRGESSQAIFHDIRTGIPAESDVEVHEIANRTQAIAFALRICKAGDTLLLLGKGHERSIQYAAESVAWNERMTLETQIKLKAYTGGDVEWV